MNEKIIDILKYFLLTFASLEIMYYVARSSLNFSLVFMISVAFTILFALDKYKVFNRLIYSHNSSGSKNTKKDQAF